MNKNITDKVKAIIDNIDKDGKTLIVLKGFAISDVIPDIVDTMNLDRLADNKIKYFFAISSERNICSYEEYLMLNDFILSQYSLVYIINNNLYMEQFPIVMFQEI